MNQEHFPARSRICVNDSMAAENTPTNATVDENHTTDGVGSYNQLPPTPAQCPKREDSRLSLGQSEDTDEGVKARSHKAIPSPSP